MNNKIKQVVVDNLKEGEYVYAMQQQLSIFKKNKMKTKNKKKIQMKEWEWKAVSRSDQQHYTRCTRNM